MLDSDLEQATSLLQAESNQRSGYSLMKNVDPLKNVRVASPCPIRWEQMTGDDRVRFCSHCSLNVYNIARLSPKEATVLITGTEDRLCARIYRRSDGTVITKDCPIGLRAVRRHVARVTGAVFASIIVASSVIFGQKPKSDQSSCKQQVAISRKFSDKDLDGGIVEGTVLDPNGAVVAGANIAVNDRKTKKSVAVKSNDEGHFRIPLGAGVYDVMVESPGFNQLAVPQLTLGSKETVTLSLTLTLDSNSVTVGIILLEPLINTTTPGKTIFSGDLIRRLPIA